MGDHLERKTEALRKRIHRNCILCSPTAFLRNPYRNSLRDDVALCENSSPTIGQLAKHSQRRLAYRLARAEPPGNEHRERAADDAVGKDPRIGGETNVEHMQ